MKKNRSRFGQLDPDAQIGWKMPHYQWHATVKSLFSLPFPMLFTSYLLWSLPAPHFSNLQDLFVLLCHFTRSWYSWIPWKLQMPSLGRPAAAPARPWHIPAAAAPPPASFLHAQNILCKAVGCSILSCFFHIDPLLFQVPKKIVRGKKNLLQFSFPKNLLLLSVPCYARPLLSDWCFSEYGFILPQFMHNFVKASVCFLPRTPCSILVCYPSSFMALKLKWVI